MWDLTAFYDDAVLQAFFYPNIGAGVGLVCRAEHPVTLYVRLGAAADQIFRLKAGEPFFEIFVVLGGAVVLLVRFVGDVVDGIRAVDPHAALDAAADFLAEQACHVLLSVQISGVLVDMGKNG